MQYAIFIQNWVAGLCRGNPENLEEGIRSDSKWLVRSLLVVMIGSGFYGATIGIWRSETQALYTAIKFPLLMICTAVVNALLNGMLAQLMGIRIRFRESFNAVISSFAIISVILGSLSPITLFFMMNMPPLGTVDTHVAYNFIQIMHVFFIALGGMAGNVRLFRLLERISGDLVSAKKVLFVWLISNLFLGSQLSWIMRPFMGSPNLPVQFFRPDAFKGNFYESTLRAFMNLIT